MSKTNYLNNSTYNQGNSPFHRLNPITNLIILICIVILIFYFSHPIFSLLLLIIVLLMYGIAGINITVIAKKARFLIFFCIFIFLIQLIFTADGNIIFTIVPNTSPILPGFLPITDHGVHLALSMTFRFLVIVFISLFFIAITDPNMFAYSLMKLGLPYRYGFMLITALNFLPQFEIEANIVRKAQLSRGIKIEAGGLKGIYNHIKFTLRPLIISALQKADSIARSMEGRGFGLYKKRTFVDKNRVTTQDKIIGPVIIGITICLLLLFIFYIDQHELANTLTSNRF